MYTCSVEVLRCAVMIGMKQSRYTLPAGRGLNFKQTHAANTAAVAIDIDIVTRAHALYGLNRPC